MSRIARVVLLATALPVSAGLFVQSAWARPRHTTASIAMLYPPDGYERAAAARELENAPVDEMPPERQSILLAKSLQQYLDEEWIEQEDHERLGRAAGAAYLAARQSRGEGESMRMSVRDIVMAVGSAMEREDMGEAFVGPWDIANKAGDITMVANYGEGADCGCG